MWEDAEVIHHYSRADALEDGVLVDVSDMGQEAGFKAPVAVTSAVWSLIENIPPSKKFQDVQGRLWDVLIMAWSSHKVWMRSQKEEPDLPVEKEYALILYHGRRKYATLKWHLGYGDEGEFVITIMLPEED